MQRFFLVGNMLLALNHISQSGLIDFIMLQEMIAFHEKVGQDFQWLTERATAIYKVQ